MKEIAKISIGELAAFVCSHLQKQGIEVVLKGGGCVNWEKLWKKSNFSGKIATLCTRIPDILLNFQLVHWQLALSSPSRYLFWNMKQVS
ncbi:MAG: hypothetical protein KAG92_00835, partial [Deltaproteobacteria bacterium]|nr:hypothetical protein [Deltaproteobacteria bacterium]